MIIFKSKKMQDIISKTQQLKGFEANVLISGETGTGKEMLARHIHALEEDSKRPFVAINCAAIPENLLESELFGYEAGAFTGALKRKIGKLEEANNGDFFLDEISCLRPEMQAKILRVLQEKEFCRLGGNALIKVNFRVISASNQPLHQLVESKKFREDLFYRLRVIEFTLPPLRDRKEDIPLLVDHFLGKSSKETTKQVIEQTMEKLVQYDWPGNVRELANAVEYTSIMSSLPHWLNNNIQKEIKIPSQNDVDFVTLKTYLKNIEKSFIERTLKLYSGNKTKTASALGICRTTFYLKIKELELQQP